MSIFLAIGLTVALGQAPQKKPIEPDYSVALGASPTFHSAVLDVERELWGKKFDLAAKKGKLLPQSVATVRIDLKNVEGDRREQFRNAIVFAIDRWNIALSGAATLKEIKSGKPDVLISFEPTLAKIATTGERAGATWFFGTTPDQAAVEAVIGLKRGPNLKQTQEKEVHNEALYSIGAYFGLGQAQTYTGAMGRVEGAMENLLTISTYDSNRAKINLRLSKNLRLAALNKIQVQPQEPSLFIEKRRIDFATTFQGDNVIEEMTIANRGNAPLRLTAYGDCSCIGAKVPDVLKPGQTARLVSQYVTSELDGEVIHNVVLETNDAENPSLKLPAKIFVRPRAVAVFPVTDTIDVTDKLAPLEFYIHSDEKVVPNILKAIVSGATLGVRFEPFSGTVKNFRKKDSTVAVRGYKMTMDTSKLDARAIYGRIMTTVFIQTDSAKLPVIKIPVFLQKGIISNPESVYLGSPTGPLDFTISVVRPGKPFKVKSVRSTSKYVSVSITPASTDTAYVLRVIYDGKAEDHKIKAEIIVETDDPKQPVIKIPVDTSVV